ncbi:MAG: hypothetical protein GXX96_24365, partial [Planctomycetaceae bacterium]|nr:hypothetical protein [Planctomycetaceae bacterium]
MSAHATTVIDNSRDPQNASDPPEVDTPKWSDRFAGLKKAPKKPANNRIMSRDEQVELFAPVIIRNTLDGQTTERDELIELIKPRGYSDSGAAKTVGDLIGGHRMGLYQDNGAILPSRYNGLLVLQQLSEAKAEALAQDLGFASAGELYDAIDALQTDCE